MADFTNNPDTAPADWQQQPKALLDDQKWDDAISLLSEVIPSLASNADKATAHGMRGLAYIQKNKLDYAIADLNRAIELNPRDARAYGNRGTAYWQQGNYNRAIINYSRVIELSPDDALAYCGRATAYQKKGDYDRAIADYDKAIELNPNDANAYSGRGFVYKEKGDYDRAIADYDRVIELNPNDASAYSDRGFVYKEKGDYDRAIADYDKAIELNPNDASAYSRRGIAYDKKNEHSRAIADYDRAIHLDPDNASIYCNRGIAYSQKGEHDIAIADLNRAVDLTPNDARIYYNRGFAYSNMGKLDLAISDWEKAIELAPKQDKDMVDSLFAGIKSATKIRQQFSQFSKKFDSELRMAEGFERREKWYRWMRIPAGLLTAILLAALFAFYVVAFGTLACRYGIINYCPYPLVYSEVAEPNASKILPWIPVVFLTSSPIIWAIRLLNRAATQRLILRENAYANYLMTLLLPIEPRDKYQEELFKRFFDRHDFRGSPQLVVDLENNKRKTGDDVARADDSVARQLLNILRQGSDKQSGRKGD